MHFPARGMPFAQWQSSGIVWAKSEALGFDSSSGTRVFSLLHARDKTIALLSLGPTYVCWILN